MLRMKPNLFQSHRPDNSSDKFSKQSMALNIRISLTQDVQRLFLLKIFLRTVAYFWM